MGVMTSANTAGVDKDHSTQVLNKELQDKGFLSCNLFRMFIE